MVLHFVIFILASFVPALQPYQSLWLCPPQLMGCKKFAIRSIMSCLSSHVYHICTKWPWMKISANFGYSLCESLWNESENLSETTELKLNKERHLVTSWSNSLMLWVGKKHEDDFLILCILCILHTRDKICASRVFYSHSYFADHIIPILSTIGSTQTQLDVCV